MKIGIIMDIFKQISTKKTIFIVLICIFIATFSIVSITFAEIKSDRVCKDVYINDINVGNLTKSELAEILEINYQNKVQNVGIILKHKSSMVKFKYADIDLKYDIETAVNQAYSHSRTGNILNKLIHVLPTINKGTIIKLPISFDKGKVEEIVNSFEKKELREVKEAELIFEGDEVKLRSGIMGEIVDRDKIMTEIMKAIMECKDISIEVPIINIGPQKINISELYTQINREPMDASIRIQDYEVEIVPEIMGISVDKTILTDIVSQMEKLDGAEKLLPVQLKAPDLTAQEINAKLFKDKLSTFSSQFSTDTENNMNRRDNIKIAVSKINGTLLAPGETFSFNEVVGDRTEEAGYKDAISYIGGKLVLSSGGGVCQVSTTLYNAVLPLGFEVEQRKNHTFAVAYVPLGMDAAVFYGLVDLMFKNITNWPVKIQGKVTENNKIYFSIIGTNEDKNETFEYYSKTLKTTDYKTEFIDDPNLYEGVTEVKQKGSKGYVVDTYKVVKKNGEVISDNKMYTSVYSPLDEEVVRGTKKILPSENPDQ